MVADGKLLTVDPTSSIDFKNGDTIVAEITRNFVGETIATLHCKTGAFGTLYDYTVNYLGWEEPEPVTLIVTPAPPVDLQNANIVLRKSDGSDFTSEEIEGLQITMQSAGILTLQDGGTMYLWRSGNTNYFRMEKAATYGSEITLINGGYEQTLQSVVLSS